MPRIVREAKVSGRATSRAASAPSPPPRRVHSRRCQYTVAAASACRRGRRARRSCLLPPTAAASRCRLRRAVEGRDAARATRRAVRRDDGRGRGQGPPDRPFADRGARHGAGLRRSGVCAGSRGRRCRLPVLGPDPRERDGRGHSDPAVRPDAAYADGGSRFSLLRDRFSITDLTGGRTQWQPSER